MVPVFVFNKSGNYWLPLRSIQSVLACQHFTFSTPVNTVDWAPEYWAMCVKCLAQGNNGLPLTGFEPLDHTATYIFSLQILIKLEWQPKIFFHLMCRELHNEDIMWCSRIQTFQRFRWITFDLWHNHQKANCHPYLNT